MMNKSGYDSIDEVMKRGTKDLSLDDFAKVVADGALILDVRSKEVFSKGFIPGSIFIGLDGQFAVWVGALITDLKQPIVLITDEGKEEEAVMRLARVGYDHCVGYLNGGFNAWKEAGKSIDKIDSVTAEELAKLKIEKNVKIIDARKPSEFEAEHAEDAILYPLDFINEHLNDLDKKETSYLHCRSGYRSVIAISILKKNGYTNLIDVLGGFAAMEKTNIPKTSFVCSSKQ